MNIKKDNKYFWFQFWITVIFGLWAVAYPLYKQFGDVVSKDHLKNIWKGFIVGYVTQLTLLILFLMILWKYFPDFLSKLFIYETLFSILGLK